MFDIQDWLALVAKFTAQVNGDGSASGNMQNAANLARDEFETKAREQNPEHLACKKGCAYCCHYRVTVTAPEIVMVTRAIHSLPENIQGEIIEKIIEADKSTRGMDDDERGVLSLPCPLLSGQMECVIYADRPISCRRVVMEQEGVCEAAFNGEIENIPISTVSSLAGNEIQPALQAALLNEDMAWRQYELNHAIVVAFNTPGFEEKLDHGEDPLLEAATEDAERTKTILTNLQQMAPSGPKGQ